MFFAFPTACGPHLFFMSLFSASLSSGGCVLSFLQRHLVSSFFHVFCFPTSTISSAPALPLPSHFPHLLLNLLFPPSLCLSRRLRSFLEAFGIKFSFLIIKFPDLLCFLDGVWSSSLAVLPPFPPSLSLSGGFVLSLRGRHFTVGLVVARRVCR